MNWQFISHTSGNATDLRIGLLIVQEAARARKESFASSNPLSLGGGGLGPRGSNMKTPLGWLTGKLTGVGTR